MISRASKPEPLRLTGKVTWVVKVIERLRQHHQACIIDDKSAGSYLRLACYLLAWPRTVIWRTGKFKTKILTKNRSLPEPFQFHFSSFSLSGAYRAVGTFICNFNYPLNFLIEFDQATGFSRATILEILGQIAPKILGYPPDYPITGRRLLLEVPCGSSGNEEVQAFFVLTPLLTSNLGVSLKVVRFIW